MATPTHTPEGRGFDSSLIYFEHKNDFFTQIGMQSECLKYDPTMVDLWSNGAPAKSLNGTKYEEYMFRDRVMSIIDDWDQQKPLFLVFTPHVAHCPLQVPEDVWQRFNFTDDQGQCQKYTPYIFPGNKGSESSSYRCRSQYHGMLSILDDHFAAIETRLKAKGVWNETLIVSSSDVSYRDALQCDASLARSSTSIPAQSRFIHH